MIGKLLNDEADIGLIGMVYTDSQHNAVIDYTVPFAHGKGMAIMMNSRRRNINFSEFVRVFDEEVWSFLFCALVLTG